jgi:hypothetical protein
MSLPCSLAFYRDRSNRSFVPLSDLLRCWSTQRMPADAAVALLEDAATVLDLHSRPAGIGVGFPPLLHQTLADLHAIVGFSRNEPNLLLSEFEFYYNLGQAFLAAGDRHLSFTAPLPFLGAFTVRPWVFGLRCSCDAVQESTECLAPVPIIRPGVTIGLWDSVLAAADASASTCIGAECAWNGTSLRAMMAQLRDGEGSCAGAVRLSSVNGATTPDANGFALVPQRRFPAPGRDGSCLQLGIRE